MKTVILFFSAILFNGYIYSQNIQDGLLIYLPFNGNCYDQSGNEFHGINFNAEYTEDPWGNLNSACAFNGYNTHVELINEPSLKPPLPLSFSFWVKFNSLEASDSQIFITDFSKNMYSGVWFGLNPDTYQMQMSYGSGIQDCTGPNCRRTKTGNTVFQTGIWYFIIGVIRGETDMSLFVNCEDDGGYYSGSGGEIAYTTNSGSIGRTDQLLLTPYYFHGVLDEFRFWNRSLSILDMANLCLLYSNQTNMMDENSSPFKLKANPVTTEILLECSKEFDKANYKIQNLIGGIESEGNISSEAAKINVSEIKSGTYILSINYKSNIYHLKFIKI
jgi:hypothetical protein